MAIIFALTHLFDAVRARFEADGVNVDADGNPDPVEQSFGWLASAEQLRGRRRIVWTPGDEGGALGAVGAAKYPGGDPRSLATLGELCTVEITAYDDGERTDERRQYQATRELFDEWMRAVYLVARGWFRVVSAKWVGGDRARRLGATIRVVIALDAPIFDRATGADATVDPAHARIDVTELEHTEILEVSRESSP